MKTFRCCAILFFLVVPFLPKAQEKHEDPEMLRNEKVEGTFNSPMLINNQTVEFLQKREIEFTFQQRFGTMSNQSDMLGLYAPSNLRIGLDYGMNNLLTVGAGISKNKRVVDVNMKCVIFRQDHSGGMPVTVAYFGEVSRNGLAEDDLVNEDGEYNPIYRISYFHELMIGRKCTERLSLQGALTYSYFNLIEKEKDNANIGISFIGRYKLSERTSFILDFDYPVTRPIRNAPEPNLGIGFEFSIRPALIQIFFTTTDETINDELRVSNHNDFTRSEFRFGFNISHNWVSGKSK